MSSLPLTIRAESPGEGQACVCCRRRLQRQQTQVGYVKSEVRSLPQSGVVRVLVSPYHGNGDWQILLENFVGRSRPLARYCSVRLCIQQLLELLIYWTSIVIEQEVYDYYE